MLIDSKLREIITANSAFDRLPAAWITG